MLLTRFLIFLKCFYTPSGTTLDHLGFHSKGISLKCTKEFLLDQTQSIPSIISFFHNDFLECERVINPFPNKPWFLRVCSSSLFKTLWEKEKLLITAISPFPTVFSTHVYPLFPLCFLPIVPFVPICTHFVHICRTFYHCNHIRDCRLQTVWVWTSPKFVFWERVKTWDCVSLLFTKRQNFTLVQIESICRWPKSLTF